MGGTTVGRTPISMFRSSRVSMPVAAGAAAVAVLLLGNLTPAMASPARETPAPRILGAGSPAAVADSYIVKLKDTAALKSQGTAARAKALTSQYKGTSERVWPHAL